MIIFDGKKEAEKILSSFKKRIKKEPILAVISVGKNKSSELFIKNKKRAADEIGIKVARHDFKKEERIIEKIKELNNDPSVNGIIVQLPLAGNFDVNKIVKEISAKKDVDGFCRGRLYFEPPLPSAVFLALKRAGFKRKRIAAVVNSDIFGITLKEFLKEKGVEADYFLRKNLLTSNLREADVVISVCGMPGFIKGDMIKEGAALIDGGVRVLGKRVIGDVDRNSVKGKASFLTPVPGGLGPANVALLLKNVFIASRIK